MNALTRKRLVRFLPPALLALLLVGRRFQLELSHLLAMAYLVWDYILILTILLLLGLGVISKRFRMAAFLMAIVVLVDFVSPTIQDGLRNSSLASGPTLKVVTFNWLGEERDRRDTYAWLATENPDIVAIQEISGEEKGLASALFGQFPYRTRPVPDVMIFSKYPIVSQSSKTLDLNSMVRAELNVQNRRLVVWNIHPATLKELAEIKARDHYLADVAQYIETEREPVLMMGDFNATRWDPGFRAIVEAGRLHEQPKLVALPTRMAVRRGVPFLGSPIDHILTNEGNVLTDCQTGPNLGSDHKPLICNFHLKN